MKYVLMFCETERWQRTWESAGQADADRMAEKVAGWLAEYAGAITHRVKLGSPEAATTLRLEDGEPIVTDGPFVEGKEVVSGIVEVDVADLDEALRMARSWPACPTVEIRPVLW